MDGPVTANASTTPIVLVHGWAGSAEAWHPIVSRLRAKGSGPVVAVRLPGSPGAPDGGMPTIPTAAAMLAETLRAQAGPVLLVGHSMGAQVTLLAHAMEPGSVLGEVMIDPAYGASHTDHAEMLEWALRIETHGHAASHDFFASAAATMPPGAGGAPSGRPLRHSACGHRPILTLGVPPPRGHRIPRRHTARR